MSWTVSDAARALCTTKGGKMTTAILLIQAIYHSPCFLMLGIKYLFPALVYPAPDPE
jgi:hypothetical protein